MDMNKEAAPQARKTTFTVYVDGVNMGRFTIGKSLNAYIAKHEARGHVVALAR